MDKLSDISYSHVFDASFKLYGAVEMFLFEQIF